MDNLRKYIHEYVNNERKNNLTMDYERLERVLNYFVNMGYHTGRLEEINKRLCKQETA